MKITNLKQIDASLQELTFAEKQQVTGGSFISRAAGWIVGAAIGVTVGIVAAGTFAIQLLSGDNLSDAGGEMV